MSRWTSTSMARLKTRSIGVVARRRCESCPRMFPRSHHGPIAPGDVASVMRLHDLFLFPTHGENFGHVIAEALKEGCPVLIANNTAFRGLEKLHAGWDLPVDDVEGFRRIVKMCAVMPREQWLAWSEGPGRLATKITSNEQNTNRYRVAFQRAAAGPDAARAA